MKKLSPRRFLQLAVQSHFIQRLRGKRQHVSKLPEELLMCIFELLPIQDLCSVIAVCQAWRTIGYDGYLWKTQSLLYFENPVNRCERRLEGKEEEEGWQTYFKRRYTATTSWRHSSSHQPTTTTLTGHVGTVWTLAFDQTKLITGSVDKTIKVSLLINV